MTKSDAILDITAEDLMAGLQAIATPAEIEMVNRFLALGLEPRGIDDAQGKARKRTARYKLRTALRREPSSQHILQACAYAVFARYETSTHSPQPIAQEVLELLVAAGFDKDRTTTAMARFVTDAGARRSAWLARTRSGLLTTIMKAIETQEKDKDAAK